MKKIERRKQEHIDLAQRSIVPPSMRDTRFYYEPMLESNSIDYYNEPFEIGNKIMNNPIWISSMTGGTDGTNKINEILAMACREFDLGMGMGSCRIFLDNPDEIKKVKLRQVAGDGVPIFANLGIAQVEKLLIEKEVDKINRLVDSLQADGLVIHVNPLQEYIQEEGDTYHHPPIDTVERILEMVSYPLIVKEVGQGMGPRSLERLMKLPLEAIEFGALGGTNFSKVESLRNNSHSYECLNYVGHTAEEMVDYTNEIIKNQEVKCSKFIISGGITNYLDGYYLMNKSLGNAIYGQAGEILKRAGRGDNILIKYLQEQIANFNISKKILDLSF